MSNLNKKRFFRLFFLIISIFALNKIYIYELVVVAKLIYILGLLCWLILITYSCLKKNFTHPQLLKRLLMFLFASISLFSYTYYPFYKQFFSGDILFSNGVLFFFIYLIFMHLMKLNEQTNNYILLLSLFFVPTLILAKSSYTAETSATFGFLLASTIALRLLYKFRTDIQIG